jgi:hypothetical protein
MISYIGGKSKIAPTLIIPNIPKDIETYVESFSGQFWVFFKMNLQNYPNLKTVVYNDFNPLNYNLYRCVKNHQKLLEECEKLVIQEKGVFPTNPICKENFNNFHNTEVVLSDRTRMLQGLWPEKSCSYCKNIEESGGVSDRLRQIDIPNLSPLELVNDPSAIVVSPTVLEVFFSNTCNLGCLYCTPVLSSVINAENQKFGSFEKNNVLDWF